MPSPFGLSIGSTPSETEATFTVQFHQVPLPYDGLIQYRGEWSPTRGLMSISACSKPYDLDDGADGIVRLYRGVLRDLEDYYGEGLYMGNNRITSNEDPSTLIERMRDSQDRLMAIWNKEHCHSLVGSIDCIDLSIHASDWVTGQLILNYAFSNQNAEFKFDENKIRRL